jgi:prephenate dehydrogenase
VSQKIAIVGLGYIGASLGLALKAARVDAEFVGHDRENDVAAKAKKIGAVDRTHWNLISAVDEAGLVLLAIPVMAMKVTLEAIAPYLRPGCVVSDVASTKVPVLAWADAALPRTVSFVGGHPIVKKAGSGIDSATRGLFQGCTYCVLPSRQASPEALETVLGIVSAIGATPYFIDPAEHDSFVAGVSHLPLLLSTALVKATAGSPSWREMRKVAGGDYGEMLALAQGEAQARVDLCELNRENLVRWLQAYAEALEQLRQQIAQGSEELLGVFQNASEARDRWLAEGPEDTDKAFSELLPTPGKQLRQIFLGGGRPRSGGS